MNNIKEIIHASIDGLSSEFLNSTYITDDDKLINFREYCLDYLPEKIASRQMDAEMTKTVIDNAILEQEASTGLSSIISNILEDKLKTKYFKESYYIIDMGVSNVTLYELIEQICSMADDEDMIEYNGSKIPATYIVDSYAKQAKKSHHSLIADKIEGRESHHYRFKVEDIAKSINPSFEMENMYVRYMLENYENSLSYCFDQTEIENLQAKTVRNITPECLEVNKEISKITNEYISKLGYYDEIKQEYGEETLGGR